MPADLALLTCVRGNKMLLSLSLSLTRGGPPIPDVTVKHRCGSEALIRRVPDECASVRERLWLGLLFTVMKLKLSDQYPNPNPSNPKHNPNPNHNHKHNPNPNPHPNPISSANPNSNPNANPDPDPNPNPNPYSYAYPCANPNRTA